MTFYRQRHARLNHTEQPVFLTWRLHDSLPPNLTFPAALNSGQAFAVLDRLLDEGACGSLCLRQPPVADMIAEALQHNANVLGHYVLHAFAIMPNHVHLLATPAVPLPKLTKSLKAATAKRANAMLASTESRFWQEESYDRLVTNEREFEQIRNYIEQNPVRAGLASKAKAYRWSSAGWRPAARSAGNGR